MRGHLDDLERVLTDMVSELKYHRQQVCITGAEKDTVGAVVQLNIVKEKNAVLNESAKVHNEIGRLNRAQDQVLEKYNRQLEAIKLDHNTCDARIMQLQRRIRDCEGHIGIESQKWED